jgi:hypothetical protein
MNGPDKRQRGIGVLCTMHFLLTSRISETIEKGI